jgi:hypothetical protein
MDAAATFRSAVSDLEAGMDQQRQARPELAFDNQPAPRKLAPYAAAIGATVHEPVPGRGPGGPRSGVAHDADDEIGWGSFVLLYDPAGQDGWAGPFRMIAYLRAELEPEIAADPLIGQVGWSWLTEALDARTTGYRQVSGTVTRVVTEGFGAKEDQPVATGFELRASWSPGTAGSGRPAGALADSARPAGARSDSARSDSARSDSARSDSARSDSARSDSARPAGAPLDLDGHIAAWCDALCAACGLPPLPAGVSALRPPRARRRP